jgi:hypothetical protein
MYTSVHPVRNILKFLMVSSRSKRVVPLVTPRCSIESHKCLTLSEKSLQGVIR